jgi:hypothetical protein
VFLKTQVPVADVARPQNLASNVVVQVADKVKQKMPTTVSEKKRFAPELLIAQERDLLTDLDGERLVAFSKT